MDRQGVWQRRVKGALTPKLEAEKVRICAAGALRQMQLDRLDAPTCPKSEDVCYEPLLSKTRPHTVDTDKDGKVAEVTTSPVGGLPAGVDPGFLVGRGERCFAQDVIGGLFAGHDGRAVQIAVGDPREDRAVDHP